MANEGGIGLSTSPDTSIVDSTGLSALTSPAAGQAPGSPACSTTVLPKLTAHPISAKSRVETQIPVKLTLHPMPPGVTKLHLPRHAVSKPKLLADPPPQRSPEMLELDAVLVCTSAMQSPEKLQRALLRAATNSPLDRELARMASATEAAIEQQDEREPLNGGDVNICDRCVERERKRLNRKRNRKPDEEDGWSRDERMRVIVFNTHEVRDWQSPKRNSVEASQDGLVALMPEGARHVDLPMRIACYCRHHQERVGFRVIFTIKDYKNRLVAQAITDSIMITDDHKTHSMPPPLNMPRPASNDKSGSRTPSSTGGFTLGGFSGPGPAAHPASSQGSPFPGAMQALSPQGSHMSFPGADVAPVRLSHSISDLQSLRNNYVSPFTPMPSAPTHGSSQSLSASATPRNLSRQASLSGPSGPATKRRKSGGRLPESLTMTWLDTTMDQASSFTTPPESAMATTSTVPSPLAASDTAYLSSNEHVITSSATTPRAPYSTGPPTPSGSSRGFYSQGYESATSESVAMHQAFSAPTSARHSRTPSPVDTSGLAAPNLPPDQIAQAVTEGLLGLLSSSDWQQPPSIHKLIPSEGPKAGGVEVSVVGSGFYQGLEVMFGDTQAMTTTFWNDRLLVCLLPPAAHAGDVLIRFKHEQQPHWVPTAGSSTCRRPSTFRYVDDDEEQLLRSALIMIGHQMTGRAEDATDVARRIVGGDPTAWRPSSAHSTENGMGSGGGGGGGIDLLAMMYAQKIDLAQRQSIRAASAESL